MSHGTASLASLAGGTEGAFVPAVWGYYSDWGEGEQADEVFQRHFRACCRAGAGHCLGMLRANGFRAGHGGEALGAKLLVTTYPHG